MADLFEDLASAFHSEPRSAAPRQRPELPKRFYKGVTISGEAEGFAVKLDGRPVKTPARAILAVPEAALAEALADEWRGQGERIDPATMPLTRLVNSAIDGIAGEAEAVAADAAKYAGSDLLCYRAEDPERLVARQTEVWDPILRWAEQRLGVRFVLAGGVMPVRQHESVVPAVLTAIPRDPIRLAAVHQLTTVMGSVLLALAVLEGRLTADEAFAASTLDEDWNIAQWGEDDEATARRLYRAADVAAAARLLGK